MLASYTAHVEYQIFNLHLYFCSSLGLLLTGIISSYMPHDDSSQFRFNIQLIKLAFKNRIGTKTAKQRALFHTCFTSVFFTRPTRSRIRKITFLWFQFTAQIQQVL